ncbi:MAG: hypothetical protein V4671_08350 [Armatimonadota bacterium]
MNTFVVAETTLSELQRFGVSVSLDTSGGLRVMPKAAITDQVRATVTTFRAELLEYLKERPAVPEAQEPELSGLPPLAAASWREKGFYKVESVIFDDVIIRATDAAPIHELHEGCVVYRNAEILHQMQEPQPLDIWHSRRKALFGKWKGSDWKTHKQIGEMRKAAGIADHHRGKVKDLIAHLVACGVIEFGESDGRALMSDCYRILPPHSRKRESGRRSTSHAI